MTIKMLKGSKKALSALGMGCFGIGGPFIRSNSSYLAYGKVKDEESIKTIHKAVELGINIFDTADIYGVGRSERILGEALKEYRDDIVIATKFGSVFEEGNPHTPDKKNTEYIRNAVESSLRPGAKTIDQIEENARTLEFGPLSTDMVQRIDVLFSDL